MKPSRKLFPYLVLNILISTITTLTVMWLWDYFIHPKIAQRSPSATTIVAGKPDENLPASVEETASANSPGLVDIENVFGVGDLETEVVVLRQVGEGKQTLTNWELKDRDGHVFQFPQLELNQDGSVQIFTRIGVNSVLELYWGLETPIWETGEQVRLFNDKGKLQATYTIP